MTIGGSIALIVLGAILAFAVELTVAGISITAIGYILMLGGLVGLAVGLVAGRRTVETRVVQPPAERRVIEERDVY
jgi:drug/metabolite transporter (DMT)-like permease